MRPRPDVGCRESFRPLVLEEINRALGAHPTVPAEFNIIHLLGRSAECVSRLRRAPPTGWEPLAGTSRTCATDTRSRALHRTECAQGPRNGRRHSQLEQCVTHAMNEVDRP